MMPYELGRRHNILRELTLSIDEALYDTIQPALEQENVGEIFAEFVKARMHRQTQDELEAGYKAMASDEEREVEAQEWCNALIGDAGDEAR
ncbi:MAG: hypothetical protein LBS37_11120 [Treponema sp.]|jgi:hypothetical protein|nr:hypothetical protein [Treponema sp.]